jgi:hypothetical protein
MRSASLRIERVSAASGKLKTELINAQRAAMVAGMEASQAKADAERAEDLRNEAVQRAKIATDRLAHSGGGAGPATTGSPATAGGSRSLSSSATQQPQQELEERIRELEGSLQAAISGRRAAEEAAVEATSRAAKAEAR